MSISGKANNMVKPLSGMKFSNLTKMSPMSPMSSPRKGNLTNIIAGTAIGVAAGTAIEENNNKSNNYLTKQSDFQKIEIEQINLLEFSRLYKIAGIPIMDFVITYILLYCINALYLKYDCKIILILTFPVTIIFNMLINEKLKMTNLILLVLVLSIICLFNTNPINNTQ